MEEMASVYAQNHAVDFDGKNVEDVYPQLVAKNLVKNTDRPDVSQLPPPNAFGV